MAGLWSSTFGDGNSFTESVANTFTPNDGASYVGGTLTYDSGDNAGTAVTQNTDGSYGSGDQTYTGSANSTSTNANVNASTGEVENYTPKGMAPGTTGLTGTIAAVINPLTALPKVFSSFATWANGLDPKVDSGQVVDGRQVYTKTGENGMSYSYNFLGMPYQVEVRGNKVVDFLSIDATGKAPGDEGYDNTTTGYAKQRTISQNNGDNDGVTQITQYEEDNANEDGEPSDGRITVEAIKEMAEKAGLVKNAEDAAAIIADPMKFLEDRNMKLEDLIPTMEEGEGTTLDGDYDIGMNDGFTATTTGTTNVVDDVVANDGTTYTAATNELTDAEMVNAAVGEIDSDNLVDAEDYTIDMTGAATGVNEDGTKNELGLAVNDWASVDLSKVIDTTTTAGKLLADKLRKEGREFVDAKTSILWQMKTIAAEFKNSAGEPVIPPWAQALHRDTMKSISFSGISGTAATAAMSNAIMEATLGVAEKEATFFQTLTTTNLSNKQEAIINKANVLSKLEMANLDVRSQAAVQNAKAFLEMDLTNLTNEQQAEVVNKQALTQALFDNTKAENAARRFGAEVANDMAKFYDELQVSIDRHNTSEMNALAKFNAGEVNDAAQFNADIKNDRQKFVAEMQYNVDFANAKWRQTVFTENFRAEIDAVTADVKSALDLTQEQQNQLWDYADNLLDYIWKTTDNDQERELRLLIAQLQAQSGQQSGGGFMEGLLKLGGAFLGSSGGSAWMATLLGGK